MKPELETLWLTKTELLAAYPRWGSATSVEHLVRNGYLGRRRETRELKFTKRVGGHGTPAKYRDHRRVWVYDSEQYRRYWESNLRHQTVLADLREENGYDG